MALIVRSLRALPPPIGATAYRVDKRGPLLSAAVIGALVCGSAWVGFVGGIALPGNGAVPGFVGWIMAVALGPIWLIALADARKVFDPDAWLAVAAPAALHVKVRSFRNRHLGRDDPQVVSIPYDAIAAARRHRRTWTAPGMSGETETQRRSFVELDLGDTDTRPLEQMLARERTLPARGMRWNHFPVTLEPGNLLRIEWRAQPGADELLALLSQRGVRVDAPLVTKVDLTHGARDEDLGELARRGDRIGLVRLLRQREGLDLTSARARAEALVGSDVERRT